MEEPSRLMICLKWFSILWTVGGIAFLAIANVVVTKELPFATSLPIDVKGSVQVALLLAPGAIAAAVHLYVERRGRKLPHGQ